MSISTVSVLKVRFIIPSMLCKVHIERNSNSVYLLKINISSLPCLRGSA